MSNTRSLCVLSGAPLSKNDDERIVNKFLSFEGKKAVCGSTTTALFCRVTGQKAAISPELYTDFNPPEYKIEGIDFASEGAITLNRCFGALNGDKPDNVSAKLAGLMLYSQNIHFIIGRSVNKGHDKQLFKSMEVLPRSEIIGKIMRKLIEYKKNVTKEEI